MEKWVDGPHLSINEKNLQNVGLKGNMNYIEAQQATFLSILKEFMILWLFKQWLIIAKFTLIVLTNS